MRLLANLFLILFTADGFVSVLTDLAAFFTTPEPLAALQVRLANLAMLVGLPLYLFLGIDRRLPKRVFVPLIGFVFLCPLLGWLFPWIGKIPGHNLILAMVQLALCSIPLSQFRDRRQGRLLMRPEHFQDEVFSFRNTLTFFGINVIVIPLYAALFMLNAADALAHQFAGGFLRVRLDGIHMIERTYTRDGKTIRLAGMMHIGEKSFYEEMARTAGTGRTIVLTEGVTDEEHRIKDRPHYDKVADLLGLKAQDPLLFRGRLITREELQKDRSGKGGQPDVLRADVDVSSFREPSIRFLNAFASHLGSNPSVVAGLKSFNTWVEKNVTPDMQKVLMEDILYSRNKELLANLDEALPKYDTVVVPWGALHMPGIEEAIKERGFIRKQERERVSVKWFRLLAGAGKL